VAGVHYGAVAAVVAASVSLAVAAPSGGADGTPPPLIGATYTHTALIGCSLDRTGLVLHYDTPGVRRLARSQLAAMHAAGLQTLRVLLWNMADITGQDWGIVPSAGDKLAEPYRSNLIRLVSDIRAAGFSGLTVSLGPEWTNNPSGEYGPSGLTADRWDPAKLDENWRLMEDVHKLVKAVGPRITHVDFIQEGAPSDYQPRFIVERLKSYIATMWTRYVAEFGKDDVSVAVIAKGTTGSFNDRLQNLVDAFRSTGLGFPAFFEVHPDWTSPAAYNDLVAVDQTLRANGLLTQPLVIGESSYENPAVAADIARFQRDTGPADR